MPKTVTASGTITLDGAPLDGASITLSAPFQVFTKSVLPRRLPKAAVLR